MFSDLLTFPKEEEEPKQPTTTTAEPEENDSASDESQESDIGNCYLEILFTLIRGKLVSSISFSSLFDSYCLTYVDAL